MQNNLYIERQSGGLCRKHAINAFFGSEHLTPSGYKQLCQNFDKYMREKGYKHEDSLKFDAVEASQESIISFYLRINGIYTAYIPINHVATALKKRPYLLNLKYFTHLKAPFVFVFNPTHIWGIKMYNNQWYTLDSARGAPTRLGNHTNFLRRTKNIGLIIPINRIVDFKYNLTLLKLDLGLVDGNNREIVDIKNKQQKIISYLSQNTVDLLGNLEVTLANLINILSFEGFIKNRRCEVADLYHEFLKYFENNRGDKEHVLEKLPKIIQILLKPIPKNKINKN